MERWTLIFFLIVFQIHAQNISSWFTTDNGLPQNSIKGIVKDKYGFIWVSTDNGIARYDGAGFCTYRDLPVGNMHFSGFHGNIRNDSIVIYSGYEENKILIHKRNPKVIKTKNLDSTGQFFYRSGSTWVRTTDNELSPYTDYLIKTDSENYIISNHTVSYTDKKVKQKVNLPLKRSKPYSMLLLNETLFIIDSENRQIHQLCKGKLTTDKTLNAINDPNTKIYWNLISEQGFAIFNDQIYSVYYSNNQLNLQLLTRYANFEKYRFRCLYFDKQFNTLYLGSAVEGLNVIQLTDFRTIQKKISAADDVSYSSLPFENNTVIDALGYQYNKNGMVKDHQFGSNEKYYIFYDDKKNILYKRNDTIFKRNKSEEYKNESLVYHSGKIINAIFKSLNFYGISETDYKTSSLHLFRKSDFRDEDFLLKYEGIVNNFIDYNNEILVGSSSGLYITSLNTKKTELIKKLNVKNILKTNDGKIWITTNKEGLFLLNKKKLFRIPLDKQHYLESAHYIVDDPYGNYWISSNNGLFKISKKQLIKTTENENSNIIYYRFTKSDGLLTNEFNGGSVPNAYLLPNKEMLFPSMEGFVFFDPAKVRTYYPDKNSIFIERVRIGNGKIIPFNGLLILENDYQSAEIFIDLPYYADPTNLEIETRIENLSTKWEKTEPGNPRKYTVRALDPGTYTLNIRVLTSPEGHYKYKTVTFEIKPLFYQTKAFKIILFLVLFLIVLLIILNTTKFIRKRNKVLKRTVSDISSELKETSQHLETVKSHLQKESEYQKKFLEAINHDITTPVKFIAMLAQKLNEEKDSETQKEYYEGIHQTSEELYKFTLSLKEYNDLYRTEQIFEEEGYALKEIFESKQKLFEKIAKEKNNHFENHLTNDIPCFMHKGIIGCIIHNLTDNAVKYSSDSIITFSAHQNDKNITLKIADTGNGMTNEQLLYYNNLFSNTNDENIQFKDYGLGLHMVIQLIKKIKAEIIFEKNLPKGTLITINLNNKNN